MMRSQCSFQIFTSLSLAVMMGASPVTEAMAQQVPPSQQLAQATPLTIDSLQNSTYQIPTLGPVTLSNGVFETGGVHNVRVRLSQQIARGDLNKDGIPDAVTVLWVTRRGADSSFYLAAVLNQNGVPNNADTAFLGHGAQVNSLAIRRAQIYVKLLAYTPNDPPCCPSGETISSYFFNPSSGILVQTSFDVQNPNPSALPTRDLPTTDVGAGGNLFEAPDDAVKINF